jgi:hypothetical protein
LRGLGLEGFAGIVLRFEQQRLPVDVGIVVGMEFHTKADCMRAIKQWHVSQYLNYKVKYLDTTRYVVDACNANGASFIGR